MKQINYENLLKNLCFATMGATYGFALALIWWQYD